MFTKTKSSPAFKVKAHNCLVLARWLESRCSHSAESSEYSKLRWQTLWAWVEWFEVCSTAADPDFLSPGELKRLDTTITIMLHGSKVLGRINATNSVARWKLRPKLHHFLHINKDAQTSGRNPRAWWTFKDEEFMGKLARIACAVHAVSLCNRSLERWCIQFFAFMGS